MIAVGASVATRRMAGFFMYHVGSGESNEIPGPVDAAGLNAKFRRLSGPSIAIDRQLRTRAWLDTRLLGRRERTCGNLA